MLNTTQKRRTYRHAQNCATTRDKTGSQHNTCLAPRIKQYHWVLRLRVYHYPVLIATRHTADINTEEEIHTRTRLWHLPTHHTRATWLRHGVADRGSSRRWPPPPPHHIHPRPHGSTTAPRASAASVYRHLLRVTLQPLGYAVTWFLVRIT